MVAGLLSSVSSTVSFPTDLSSDVFTELPSSDDSTDEELEFDAVGENVDADGNDDGVGFFSSDDKDDKIELLGDGSKNVVILSSGVFVFFTTFLFLLQFLSTPIPPELEIVLFNFWVLVI